MVELQGNIARYLPRNLSYSGNYHSFYWPVCSITSCCVKKHRNMQSSTSNSCTLQCEANSAASHARPNGELKLEGLEPKDAMVPSTAECKAMRTLSTVSDSDTTFSDDYTRMTESTSTTSEQEESDFSTPTGSVCSDLDDTFDSLSSSHGSDMQKPQENGPRLLKPKSKDSRPKLKLDTEKATSSKEVEDIPVDTHSPDDSELPVGCTTFEDREFDFLQAEPVRRSTSLKTYKTPPGTPGRKKAVRFADALGLDLESVRHVLNLDAPPEIPASAVKDLKVGVEEFKATEGNRYLTACFTQPGGEPDFVKRVLAEYVCLENCLIDDKGLTVTGTVKVANISYHKYVTVRYTTNSWITSEDICASYVVNSNDGPTDRFSFTISIPQYFGVGNKMEFAIRYATGGQEYWDNNRGKNYCIECFARSVPLRDSDTEWIHFL